jgi:hypothetical protein
MTYTTQGLMTPADLAEHQQDHDTALNGDCPGHYAEPGPLTYCSIADNCPAHDECWLCSGPLDDNGFCADGDCDEGSDYDTQVKQPSAPLATYERLSRYLARSANGKLTARQRRRLIKKAAHNRDAIVIRDEGMGYPRSMQGYKELALGIRPVSGIPG